ncbi:immunoglobulin domain-containing protein [Actinotalea ferrariae]|uniref:GON domain-containing protein n=1 Tax=Actinotalea ferrariae TaxID=1386098 RepID=UPI001ED3B1A8|nr:GON domain-containing protein [Actinotalea ferrariae]MBX9246193.1 immunoglobulin domain-containing protein [Actinotalea ferrariae]
MARTLPVRLPARLTTTGLALTALLAPVAVASTASAAISPHASCADVAAAVPGAADGTYAITVFGQTLDVWCADMAGAPVEYLSLGAGNTSLNGVGGDVWGSDVVTTYSRVRLQLPAAAGEPFTVLRTDRRFSTSTGVQARPGSTTDWVAFAGGGNCGGNPGRAEVSFAGTPFAVEAAEFAVYGWDASGAVAQVTPQQLSMWSAGWCSSVGPANPNPGLPWETGHPEVFPLVWIGAVAPVVTGPVDTTVGTGGTATFTTSATGDAPLTVQWQTSSDGATWSDVLGATTGTLELVGVTYADSGRQVRAVHTNPEGSVTSAAATLTVLASLPVFTTDPQDASLLVGDDVTLSAAATGDPAPTLQWQASEDGGTTWLPIPGETGTDLVLEDAPLEADGLLFRAVASNPAGDVVSAEALLTVSAVAPTITAAPTSASVAPGADATFTIAVAGTPAPTVQWQVRTSDGLLWVDVPGATGTTLTVEDVTLTQDGAVYRAVVQNVGGVVLSDPVTLRVLAPAVVVPVATPAAPTAPAAAAAAAALPVTGGTPAPIIALALALIAAGGIALAGSRRARTTV